MYKQLAIALSTFLVFTSASLFAQSPTKSQAQNWHQWRGPYSTGVSLTANPPTEWSENKNIKWKVEIDGAGSSTPIIWEDNVYLLTAINTKVVDPDKPRPEDQPMRVFGIKHPNTFYDFFVLCLDRETGKEKWRQKTIRKVPHEGHHGDNDFASASPVTDGKRLYCWFGSAGFYCFDLNGKALWKRDLGLAHMGASLGEGCSPTLHDDKIVIVRDHQRQSSIEVLDAESGQTIWKSEREEGNAWATPVVIKHSGRTQVITAASNRIRSYDLYSGEIIWECGGLTGNVTPCPVIQGDNVICMSGYKGHSVMSVPLSSKGDITESGVVAWKQTRGTPYVPSPVLYDGLLFFNQSNSSIWTCLDANSGDTLMDRTRLPGIANIYASPVAAADRIYVTGRNGQTLVLGKSKELKVIASNKLDELFDASPAIAGSQLFLRGDKHLYCIAK